MENRFGNRFGRSQRLDNGPVSLRGQDSDGPQGQVLTMASVFRQGRRRLSRVSTGGGVPNRSWSCGQEVGGDTPVSIAKPRCHESLSQEKRKERFRRLGDLVDGLGALSCETLLRNPRL